MKRKITLLIFALGLATSIQAVPTPGLKKIMMQLGSDTQQIQTSLLQGSLKGVASWAMAVADHPQVSTVEKKSIMKTLGKDIKIFKKWDVDVHQTAKKLSQAATQGDLIAAQTQYQQMLKACFACHDQFRDRLR